MNAYLAIDIETTGLNARKHQILQVGAVYDDPKRTLMECPSFEATIDPGGDIVGSSYALWMNRDLLKFIAENDCPDECEAIDALMEWLWVIRRQEGIDKFHLVGKNVGGFDKVFLEDVASWDNSLFHYRCLEVGSMYATPEGMSGQAELIKQLELGYHIHGVA